jgi:lipopolysaccharide transport system ATP-binding protein
MRREDSEWIWVLRDISFEVPEGDVVGIIGRNGAGKTTLLKVLSRITEPTTGQATLRGRVGSLLEVGTGFHPELTGRENVFMSGAILGMSHVDIRRKFSDIIEFAGVEQFLDTPVKRYSSGMQVRLGFAVAAHLETEILVVDEVLAVGDAEFQKKCLAAMGTASREGRTVLFVSHNMAAIEALCVSGILLERGEVVRAGTAEEVIADYLRRAVPGTSTRLVDRLDRQGSGELRVHSIEADMQTGQPSELRIRYEASSALRNVAISVGLFTTRGDGALFLGTDVSGAALSQIPARGTFRCQLGMTGLLPGQYSMNVYCTVNGVVADWITDAARIDVKEGDFYGTGKLPPPGYGNVVVPYSWSVEE